MLFGYVLPENEDKSFPNRMPIFKGYPTLTLKEVLSDESIEAVFIETEECHLTKYALMAARAGKHIHMEKPGSQDKKAFAQLIDTVKKNGKIFHTGYMYRYNPEIIKLIDKVKRGELGEIIGVEAQMNSLHERPVREWLSKYDGGIMFYLGCHLIDLILTIQGTPEKIIPINRKTGLDGIDSTDFGFVLFEYERGISFAKSCSCEQGGFDRRELVVKGTKGTVELKPLEIIQPVEGGSTLKTHVASYTSGAWIDLGKNTNPRPSTDMML